MLLLEKLNKKEKIMISWKRFREFTKDIIMAAATFGLGVAMFFAMGAVIGAFVAGFKAMAG